MPIGEPCSSATTAHARPHPYSWLPANRTYSFKDILGRHQEHKNTNVIPNFHFSPDFVCELWEYGLIASRILSDPYYRDSETDTFMMNNHT